MGIAEIIKEVIAPEKIILFSGYAKVKPVFVGFSTKINRINYLLNDELRMEGINPWLTDPKGNLFPASFYCLI